MCGGLVWLSRKGYDSVVGTLKKMFFLRLMLWLNCQNKKIGFYNAVKWIEYDNTFIKWK